MMKKIICIISYFLTFLFVSPVIAQSEEISKIMEQIKVSYELEKLNDCRIKLRAIEFSQLKTKAEKEQYAEAYRQLALGFRNHRYSRPAYDIYVKYLSLRDTIMSEEKRRLISETQKKHSDLHASVLNEISVAEKEKKNLLDDKATLDSLKKNSFRYSILFTIVLIAAFAFILMKYNNKLKASKNLLHVNRKNIFEKSSEVTYGQMALGVSNNLKFVNENIADKAKNSWSLYEAVNNELRPLKEAEQSLKNLKENISQIKQLSEISGKTITNVLQKISGN